VIECSEIEFVPNANEKSRWKMRGKGTMELLYTLALLMLILMLILVSLYSSSAII
jgi:hypothetical protein